MMHLIQKEKLRFLSFLVLLLILSCTKDSDLFHDTPSSKEPPEVESQQPDNGEDDEDEEETDNTPKTESRITKFFATGDAHLQNDTGYNQSIVRIQEGLRISYIKFNLGPINDIGGTIEEAELKFTIDTDDGNGTINVHASSDKNWSESTLNKSTAPVPEILLGSKQDTYAIGETVKIELDTENLSKKEITLVLTHKGDNDLAFASKEHPNKIGPKLTVTYTVPVDAPEITDTGEDDGSEGTDNETPKAIIEANPLKGKVPLTVSFKGSNSTDNEEISEYLWTFMEGATSNKADTEYTFEEVGTYEVELMVTDSEGLSHTETVTVTVEGENNEAPVARVTADPTSGNVPLKVEFSSESSSDDKEIVKYLWQFRDGTTSTDPNPSHTFTEGGTFNVSLTVEDAEGLKDSKTITITPLKENEAPKAVVTANPVTGAAPLEVQFISHKSTDDKEIVSRYWDFKDGHTANNINPSHSFKNPGTYDVIFIAKDAEGLKSTVTTRITVTESESDNQPPIAVISANPTSGQAPLNVQFSSNGSSDDKGIVNYHWDFRDGSTGNSQNPSHTFQNPGTYNVRLTVKDAEGLTHTKNITINVEEDDSGGGSTEYPPGAVFASDYGFNSSDATDAFQAAIKSGKSFIVIDKQSSDWIVKPSTFYDLSNTTIFFEPGVVVRAKAGAFPNTNDQLFKLSRPKNVVIEGYGASIVMRKSEYNDGEHRHALSIIKGTNITVKGLTFSDSGGDGVIIAGEGSNGSYSQNIVIEDIISKNNRRQGLSIISAKDVWIRNSQFTGTGGTNPQAGVDLEPNYPNERLVNINLENCKFTNNDGAGLMFAVGKLTSSSIPISVNIKNSTFINNSLSTNGRPQGEITFSQGTHNNPVKGSVNFTNVQFRNAKYRIIFSKISAEAYTVNFKNCTAKNVGTSGSDPIIELQTLSSENSLGGFSFDNFYIEYSKNVPFMLIQAPQISGFKVKNISGTFEIKEPYDNPIEYKGGYNPANNVNVNIDYTHID